MTNPVVVNIVDGEASENMLPVDIVIKPVEGAKIIKPVEGDAPTTIAQVVAVLEEQGIFKATESAG